MIVGPAGKIQLTALSSESLEQLRQWRNEPGLRRYFREFRELSNDMQQAWFKNRVMGNPNQFDFEIRTLDGLLIGHASLNYISWTNRTAEFGIYIGSPAHRNGGFGSDALRALLGYGFDTLNLNRIWCEVFSNNDAIAVYEHIGFFEEGRLRQHHYDEGTYMDCIMMGMLKLEWEEMRNAKN